MQTVIIVNNIPILYDSQSNQYLLDYNVWPVNKVRFQTMELALKYIEKRGLYKRKLDV